MGKSYLYRIHELIFFDYHYLLHILKIILHDLHLFSIFLKFYFLIVQ